MENKIFNIVISGTGGQGLITLLQIIARAALIEGKDVKTSELHGLSQRGGSVETHIRIGKKVYSPLIKKGDADLVLALETIEGLRSLPWGNKETVFVINKFSLPFENSPSLQETENNITSLLGKKANIVPASEICQKELGKEVVSGIYLLSWAAFRNFIALKPESILEAIKKVVPEKHLEINQKAFELAKK
jgi:indolepyruvate ferredoxin oxidoreductase, beta subunit